MTQPHPQADFRSPHPVMRVAIVHYHLKPGGVTRVIENAVTALVGRDIFTVVAAADAYTGKASLNTLTVPGLSYTRPNEKPDAGALCFSLKAAARKALGGDPDLWHIHNHSLGKNNALPQVVEKLAHETAVLLQIHDFAEDGRPQNHRILESHLPAPERLYPVAPHIHYAALNGRDLRFLQLAGIPRQQLHFLPNPVTADGDRGDIQLPRNPLPGISGGSALTLYPTRAIRRKNIGELLLWALTTDADRCFATTLIPANPDARKRHHRWQQVAHKHRLPVLFGVGEESGWSFPQLMQAADTVITTSIAEGFGLAFLEPWLFRRRLCGRDIPEITCDFAAGGIDLKHLYPRLDIPLEAVGAANLRGKIEAGIPDYYAAYQSEVPPDAVERAWDSIVTGDQVDFGGLDESLQETAITSLVADRSMRGKILPKQLPQPDASAMETNCKAIIEQFNLLQYGEKLAKIYAGVLTHPIGKIEYLRPRAVLGCFLCPERFRLLRT